MRVWWDPARPSHFTDTARRAQGVKLGELGLSPASSVCPLCPPPILPPQSPPRICRFRTSVAPSSASVPLGTGLFILPATPPPPAGSGRPTALLPAEVGHGHAACPGARVQKGSAVALCELHYGVPAVGMPSPRWAGEDTRGPGGELLVAVWLGGTKVGLGV